MTTSSGASSFTPSGFLSLLAPPPLEPVSPPPLVAHALSRLAPGTTTIPRAAARRSMVRRSMVDVGSGDEPSCGESDMYVTPRFGSDGPPGRPGVSRLEGDPVLVPVGPVPGRDVWDCGTHHAVSSSLAARWPATARAVTWNAACARSWVRCATAV